MPSRSFGRQSKTPGCRPLIRKSGKPIVHGNTAERDSFLDGWRAENPERTVCVIGDPNSQPASAFSQFVAIASATQPFVELRTADYSVLMTGVRPLDHTFTTVLQGDMGPNKWTCAIMADSQAVLGTGKALRVVATIDGETITTSMLPHKGGHMLAIKKSVQDAIGKHAGDTVTVHLSEHLS